MGTPSKFTTITLHVDAHLAELLQGAATDGKVTLPGLLRSLVEDHARRRWESEEQDAWEAMRE